MAQLFHRSINTVARVSIAVGVVSAGLFLGAADAVFRSPYFTDVGKPKEQAVPFSHKHHVNGLGLDCRYCHTSVETAAFAGIPPTETCMTCHSQIWQDSEMLEPVRESYRTNRSLRWNRVYDLPDFVYFDHSAHVQNGIGCTSCHGQVDQMPLMWREASLYMEWCLGCHRAPENFVRPKEEVFSMEWQPPSDQREQGKKLVQQYEIESLTDCSTCHR